jgi:hypothetical protein
MVLDKGKNDIPLWIQSCVFVSEHYVHVAWLLAGWYLDMRELWKLLALRQGLLQ